MDTEKIAELKDCQSSILTSFEKIEKNLQDYERAEPSQKLIVLDSYKTELKKVKININLMDNQLALLEGDNNKEYWTKIIEGIKSKNNSFKQKLNNKNVEEPKYIEEKIAISQMTTQQAIDRGDDILKKDKNSIQNMKKIVIKDLNTMKEINTELLSENEKLENSEQNLKNIDNSLNRAKRQIKSMFAIFAKDKLIMCMIFFILLVIIAIFIISFFGDNGDNNLQNDTFKN